MNCFAIRAFFLILVVLKGSERLFSPGIWAEDGTLFLKQAFEHGLSSLFIAYDGYFHTLPRIIAIIATWMPVKLIPFFIVLVSYGVFAYTITLFFAPAYQWIFRSRFLSCIAALFLLLAPGQLEMLGNMTNLHWYLLFLLSVLTLKDLDAPYTYREIALAFICVSSSGASFILLPVFVLRVVLKWNAQRSFKYGELSILTFILISTLIHVFLSEGSSLFYYPLIIYIQIFIRHFFHSFVFHPFLGDSLAMHMHVVQTYYYGIALLMCVFVAFTLRRDWDRAYVLLIGLSLCSLLLPVIITMARPLSMEKIIGFSNLDIRYWFRSRYSFYIPAVAVLFWIFLLSRIRVHRAVTYSLATLMLCVQLFLNSHRFVIHTYATPTDWFEKADEIQASLRTGCPDKVWVKIAPEGWYLDLVSRKERSCEKEKDTR